MSYRRHFTILLILALACGSLVSAGDLYYFGVSVEKHPWRSTLTEWKHSRDWIGRVARERLAVAADKDLRLDDPTAVQLRQALTELAGKLQPDDTTLFYLGTHQLKAGRVLLGDKTETTAAELATLLAQLPGRTILLADVCYAAAFEEAAGMPETTVRIYAADSKEKAPSLDLSGRFRGAVRFYGDAIAAYAPAPEGCSQFGMSFLDALHRVAATDPTVPIDQIVITMQLRQEAFAKETRTTKTPEVVGANLKDWPLLGRQVKAERFQIGVEQAPTTTGQVVRRDSIDEAFVLVDQLLALPPAEIDPARANLLMGKLYDPTIVVDDYLAQLDAMAAGLKPKLANLRSSQEIAAVMAEVLFADYGFTAMPEAYAEDFLLHRLLDTKKGRCAALVSLYLSLAYRLDLPLQSYCVPEHVLIRTEDGVNVETTLKGVTLPDEKYLPLAAKVAPLEKDPFYLTLQDKRQHAGTLLSPLASALRDQGRLALAEAAGKRAVAINPNDAEAWNNLGMIQRLRKNTEAAAVSYGEAVRIHPGFGEAWNNLGVLQPSVNDKIIHFRRAVGAKPTLGVAWKNLAIAYDEAGMQPLAWAAVRRASQLGVPLSRSFVDRLRQAAE